MFEPPFPEIDDQNDLNLVKEENYFSLQLYNWDITSSSMIIHIPVLLLQLHSLLGYKAMTFWENYQQLPSGVQYDQPMVLDELKPCWKELEEYLERLQRMLILHIAGVLKVLGAIENRKNVLKQISAKFYKKDWRHFDDLDS